MSVYKTGTVDINNSTTTKLNNGETFTGTYSDVSGYETVTISGLTDQNGLIQHGIQFIPLNFPTL
jgi:hypothetical protein